LLQCGGSKWCGIVFAGDRSIAFGGERFSGERSFKIGVDGTVSEDLLGVVGRGRPFNIIESKIFNIHWFLLFYCFLS